MKSSLLKRDYPLSETKMSDGEKKKTSSDTKNAVMPYRRGPNISDAGEKIYQGPLRKGEREILDEEYPSTKGGSPSPRSKGGYTNYGEKLTPAQAESYNRSRAENELRKSSKTYPSFKLNELLKKDPLRDKKKKGEK